jgi:hypothetical protein
LLTEELGNAVELLLGFVHCSNLQDIPSAALGAHAEEAAAWAASSGVHRCRWLADYGR